MSTHPQPRDLILGIDLGGTKISSVVATPDGKVVARSHGATPSGSGPEAAIDVIFQLAQDNAKQAGTTIRNLRGAGIGAPGPLDPEKGVVFSAPNLPRWRNVPLKQLLEHKLGIPTFVGNDANAAALAELHFGAGKGLRDFIYVTVSTGIGGGIIIGGRLYVGTRGAAGEIGHMTIDVNGPTCGCGNSGCWEVMASGTALARRTRDRIEKGARSLILELAQGDKNNITGEVIALAERQGDALARETIAETGYYLGVGFANLINLFNPEMIVVGGGLSRIGEPLLGPAIEVARKRSFPVSFESVRFAPAKLTDDAGPLGAVVLAAERLGNR